MNKKTLIFEGAGWSGADTSKELNVTNCRIRTRIRNKVGRLIYLELGGCKFSGKHIPNYAKGLNIGTHIDHCFYADSEWDNNRNHSKELSHIERSSDIKFEYNKENILKFVNENLNCDFDSMEVVNEGLNVHSTNEPLCDCSIDGYKPYKQIEVNILELDNIKPLQKFDTHRTADFKIGYEYIKQIPYLERYIQERTEREKQEYPNFTFYARFRWNQEGIISSLEISARQNFCTMGLGAEELEAVINAIKAS